MSKQPSIDKYFPVKSGKTLSTGADCKRKFENDNGIQKAKKKQTTPTHNNLSPVRITNRTKFKTPTKIKGHILRERSISSNSEGSPVRNSQKLDKNSTPSQSKTSPLSSPVSTNGTPRRGKFNLRTSSPIARKRIALNYNRDKSELIIAALDQLNLAKQGAIPLNDFNLEEIYSKESFHYEYSSINPEAELKYELEEVVSYTGDIYCDIFFTSILAVFSDPINCGYFEEEELDFIYSIITLPVPAQKLLVRMLKRQRVWYRESSIDYPDIQEIHKAFCILKDRGICSFEINEGQLDILLELLRVEEAKALCKELKIVSKGNKAKCLAELKKFAKGKPVVSTQSNLASYLCSCIMKKLGYCVCITSKMWDIFDRIMTLWIPNQDPRLSIADIFFNLIKVFKQEITFPKMPDQRFPIFANKEDLLRYIQAKAVLTEIYASIKKKDLQKVRDLGYKAKEELRVVLPLEAKRLTNSNLPSHVKHFMPGYMWLKAMAETIDGFKNLRANVPEAINILNILLNQNCHMQHKKGEWYAELALIEMHHNKDIIKSALAILRGLRVQNATEIDRIQLIDRANRIIKRKTAINEDIRKVQDTLRQLIQELPALPSLLPDRFHKIVDAPLPYDTLPGRKKNYCIEANSDKKSYGSVEDFALSHYRNLQFEGLHCEGALPVTLFCILFWEAIYDVHVPGAYVTLYQDAPQDLFTDRFYENRKFWIDSRRQIIKKWNVDQLSDEVGTKLNEYKHYQSLIHSNLFDSSDQLKKIVQCMGVSAVLGICDRMIRNFKMWRAGFPDLIVWNHTTKQCKLVEVKSPKDELSNKQEAWLIYLHELGLDIEVLRIKEIPMAKYIADLYQ